MLGKTIEVEVEKLVENNDVSIKLNVNVYVPGVLIEMVHLSLSFSGLVIVTLVEEEVNVFEILLIAFIPILEV
jgi:hypothetical protein